MPETPPATPGLGLRAGVGLRQMLDTLGWKRTVAPTTSLMYILISVSGREAETPPGHPAYTHTLCRCGRLPMTETHASELTRAEEAELEEACKAVLDDDWVGNSTVPSPSLYPHQWSWDSAFIAIGRSWYDQPRAQTELETLFDAQWANGML